MLSVEFFPLPFSSCDTAPCGTGLPPLDGPLNGVRNLVLAAAADLVATGRVRRAFQLEVRRLTGVRVTGGLFDLALTTDACLQTSVPQFEYPRRRLPAGVRFVGPLPPSAGYPCPRGGTTRTADGSCT